MTKALLLGATGFTGSHVAPLLLDAGYEVTCMVRATSDTSCLPQSRLRFVEGDLGDPQSLVDTMRGHEILVCVASIGFGHGPSIVNAARAAGIRRALFVSTTAIFTSLDARTKTVRAAAEQAIRESGLDWTILRPTMIYGTARDRNMIRLIRYLRRWPVMFVIGSGQYLQQPIHVDDVARAVVDAVKSDVTIGRAYNIAGAAPLTFHQVIEIVTRLLRRRVRKLRIPVAPVVAVLRALERMHLRAPIRAEQILRLNEDKAFPYDEAARDFGFSPRSFEEGIAQEIASVERNAGVLAG